MYLLLLLSIATLALAEDNPAANQLVYFKNKHKVPIGELTLSSGAPVFYNDATSSLNTNLLLNPYFMESINHLVRERIHERLVHAKGAGAFGYFEVTKDVSHICRAHFLSEVGKQTPVAVRFSQSHGERGFTELNRDSRGIAIKMYTQEGIFDLVTFNTEVYAYNDPITFHPFVHSGRRNPATNLFDPMTFWDAVVLNPITLRFVLITFSDRGVPASYRNMPGFSNHLYQVENSDGDIYFIKFHILPNAGIKNLTIEEAKNISALNQDYFTTDLYGAIAKGDYPSWTFYGQILSIANVTDIGPRAFDVTRTICTIDYPLQELGVLYLNRNPKNFFAEVEQLAFCPCNLVPGILGAPGKLFEARILAYKNAHMYRLRINANKIPVNCPYEVDTYTFNKDGESPVDDNEGDAPDYYPNWFNGPIPCMYNKTRLITIVEGTGMDNMEQNTEWYNSLNDDEKNRLVKNLVTSLSKVTENLQQKVVNLLTIVDSDLGDRISQGLSEANA